MPELLLAWLFLVAILIMFGMGRAHEGGVLTLSYFLSLSLIHVPGALAYLSPRAGLDSPDETFAGFQLTVLGMASFMGGVLIARVQGFRLSGKRALPTASEAATSLRTRAANYAIVAGFVSYFGLLPFARFLPSATSIVSTLGALLILGLWLRLDAANRTRDHKAFALTLAALPALPLATLVSAGFIGFGVNWIISVFSFVFVHSRRRWLYVAAAPLVVVAGLSLFVAYIGERSAIRDAVWARQSGFGERFDRVAGIVSTLELLDLDNPQHAWALNSRLNQNELVGVGVLRHRAGVVDLLYGATVQPWALIPRAIWKSKPVIGGSGDLVSNFTGITFAEYTSVGTGQVMELYMNFAELGVVIGFIILGYALRRLDYGLQHAIARNDFKGLLMRGLPGIMLLQPGGSLVEIMVAIIASLVAAWGIGKVLPRIGLATAPERFRPVRPGAGK